MSRTDTLRIEIARLVKTEADLHDAIAKHVGDANKHSADASKKLEAAAKTKSLKLSEAGGELCEEGGKFRKECRCS